VSQLNVRGWTITVDSRFDILSALYPYDPADGSGFVDREHALGKLQLGWYEAAERHSSLFTEARLAVVLKQTKQRAKQLFEALEAAELGEQIECDDGEILLRLRGCDDRNNWLEELSQKRREAGAKGGKQSGISRSKQTKQTSKQALKQTRSGARSTTLHTDTIHSHKDTFSLSLGASLESVYARYPKKQGKAKGLAAAKAKVKTPEDLEQLRAFVERMAKDWAGHDTTYCPQWSTFVSQERWRDDEPLVPSQPRLTGRAGKPAVGGLSGDEIREFAAFLETEEAKCQPE